MSQAKHEQLSFVLLNIATASTTHARRPDLAARTHCENGHEFTLNNIKMRGGRNRVCRACIAERARKRRKAKNLTRNDIGGSLQGEWQGPKVSPEIRAARKRRRELERSGEGEWQGPRLDPREYVDNIKLSNACMDCGGRFHPAVMDFDHRPGEIKVDNVSRLVSKKKGRSTATLVAEIAKCDLVCSNCHRLRTFTRLGMSVEKTARHPPPLPVLHLWGHVWGWQRVDAPTPPVRASVREFDPVSETKSASS